MKLYFDIGNSRVKVAVQDERGLRTEGRIPHSGDWPRALSDVLDRYQPPEYAGGCYVSSETLAAELDASLQARWGVSCNWLRSVPEQAGLVSAYESPELLGADRWAAMLGALERGHAPACVVDCGTAATLDVVAADGHHKGGLIFAGLSLSRQALSSRAHRLSDAGEGELPLLATETLTAIRSGTFHALCSAVDGLYRSVRDSLPEIPRLILTGGDAHMVAPALEVHRPIVEPDLVFWGLVRAAREKVAP
ncbi:MAG: type III pantothenate kinase [Ectothiorhodospiraceae bacterium]|nr:type III pantothenate kinase [Ectothiorhodospiraceae bacterium]MCH8506641.1 type III pantothenate kinase [Ectothiorhodospiraceae bacterium]